MRAEESGGEIRIVTWDSSWYPELLRQIKAPPKKLYCIGRLDLLKRRCIAMVGSRKTTQYGRNTARELAGRLAGRGITVVSGMAAGIDACAHEGALRYSDDTIAVLGCGPDVCYPKINLKLKQEIASRGLIVSEYPPGTLPDRFRFPERNRIISGLCEGTVVVQAGMKSGAMITAEMASEQGRAVYAVPGNIDSQYNLGSNQLIRDGATAIISSGDLLDLLKLPVVSDEEAQTLFSDQEKQVYELLCARGEMTIDEICFALGGEPAQTTRLLAVMELKGVLFHDMGKIFVAKREKTTYNH